ncbi:MAG: hypothetical protein HOQ29_08540 [Acidobacteria bacterium]|nr:hypothetical protein [Acidobacteriota bacterium]
MVRRRNLLSSVLLIAAIACSACARQEARLQQHREKFESLGASTKLIGEAWLAGRVSRTYTTTALERIYLLVEQERQTLAAQPATLADSRGATLSQAAERLSRDIAAMLQSVRGADGASVRRQLASVPIAPREPQ